MYCSVVRSCELFSLYNVVYLSTGHFIIIARNFILGMQITIFIVKLKYFLCSRKE